MIEQQKKPLKRYRHHWIWTFVNVRLGMLLIAISCGVTLSGCNFMDTVADLIHLNGSQAEAQTDTQERISTQTIQANTFRIEVDDDANTTPDVMVKSGGVIEFTMPLSFTGIARFTPLDSDSTFFELEQNDKVLLQINGTTGVVIIIRED